MICDLCNEEHHSAYVLNSGTTICCNSCLWDVKDSYLSFENRDFNAYLLSMSHIDREHLTQIVNYLNLLEISPRLDRPKTKELRLNWENGF